MTRYLFDTGIASDFINHRKGVYEEGKHRVLAGNVIGICTPVLGELVGGIYGSDKTKIRLQKLESKIAGIKLWPYEKDSAIQFGKLQAYLRQIGRPMQQVDIQVAAIAQSLDNCIVVTKDSDFQAIPKLKIEDWSI